MNAILVVLVATATLTFAKTDKCRILALGGGGTLGAYEAGVIEGLITSLPATERSYDYITGVSVGALNMIELAFTNPGEEESAIAQLKDLWFNIKSSDIFVNWQLGIVDGLFFKKGAFDSSPEKELIKGRIKGREFKRKFQFATTDMSSGQVKYVDETCPREKLIDYLMATSAFPGALPYQSLDGTEYSDGGCILNINVVGAMNRCLKDGFLEEDIIVDSVINHEKKQLVSNMSDSVAYQMVLRYFSINSYLKTWYDVYDAIVAYPEAKFRYIISPTKSLPQYPIVPLDFKTADLIKMYQIGLDDGINAVKKSVSNAKEEIDGFRKFLFKSKYGNAFD